MRYTTFMNTRLALVADFEDLYKMWESIGLQLYPAQDELKRFADMLDLNPDLCLVLVDQQEKIIGSVLGGFDGRTASIHRLAITTEHQKNGLGKQLLTELEAALRKRGIKKLAAQVHISNTAVIPFYEKQSFSEMTYVKTYFKDI